MRAAFGQTAATVNANSIMRRPGALLDSFPWRAGIFRILEGLVTSMRRTDALTTRTRTVETLGEQLGPGAWTTLQDLATALPKPWASGAFASTA